LTSHSLRSLGSTRSIAEVMSEAMELLLDFNASGEESVRTLRMYLLAGVLKRYAGNQCRAARRLGIHRNTIRRQIEEFHLKPLVAELVKKHDPQLGLFKGRLGKPPARAGLAQDVLVLNRNSQRTNAAYQQLINRSASASG